MLMKSLAVLMLGACLSCALQAQSYTVSDGTLGSYPVLSGATNLTLADDDLSAPISPSGFSFNYFGVYYSSFQVGTNGYIVLGGNGTTTATSPDHASAPGLVIAPAWVNLTYPFGGTSYVRWRLIQGVLQVEWNNMAQGGGAVGSMPPPSADIVISLDTLSGVIEFDYGFPGASNVGVTSALPYTAAISSASGSGQEIIPAYIQGMINVGGSIAAWPQYRYVRFTPVGAPANSAPQISVTVGGATVGDGGVVNVMHGQAVGAINLLITVSDADGDPTSVVGSVANLNGEGILDAEFSSAAAGVPYTLSPASGAFTNASATLPVTLVASDGVSVFTQFTFSIHVSSPAGGGLLTGSGGGGGGGCAAATGRGTGLTLFMITLVAVGLQRFSFGRRKPL